MRTSAKHQSGNKSPPKTSGAKRSGFGRLFLVDGSALAYRSHFAFIRNPLTNSKGENTSAVFGFARSLLKIIDDEQPDFFVVVFDTPEPTFRHKKYAEYKATRERMPDELVDQLSRIHAVSEALGVPIVEVPGFEADDVMATMARVATEQNIEVTLVTGDKDLMQLVGPGIRMLRLNPAGAGDILDEAGVARKMGVPPAKIVDLLSLLGDSSDNVPGVPGVGQVTACQLIDQFGSLDAVLAHAAEVKKASVRNSLLQNRDKALLSRELITLNTHVECDLEVTDLKYKGPDRLRAAELFRQLEFDSLAERFAPGAEVGPGWAAGAQTAFDIIDTPEKLAALAEHLRASEIFAVDTETTSTDPMSAELVGMSFAWEEGPLAGQAGRGRGVYVPIAAPGGALEDDAWQVPGWEGSSPATQGWGFSARPILQPILEDAAGRKCGQNAKYDLLVLARYGVHVRGLVFDTMLASYLLNPAGRQHNLDALALEYLRYKKIPTSELIGPGPGPGRGRMAPGKKQASMREVPVEKVAAYAAEDADITLRLYKLFAPKLRELELEALFESVEMPLVRVLAAMEYAGVALDIPYLRQMSADLDGELRRLEERIYGLAGEKFNLNSPQQLGKILFEKLKLPKSRRTKTGYSTDADVLASLARRASVGELPRVLLDYRELAKLKSTYVDALPRLVNPRTGRVHTSYNQAVTRTGRLSSSDPNLQNIPIRTEVGRQVRRAFVPAPRSGAGWKLLDADYSQIELRIMAHLSKDAALLDAFHRDADIHRDTAARVFNLKPDEVTAEMRRRAKEINFGIMYGMGAYGLSQRLEISVEEAQEFIDNYFVQYPGVKAFIAATIADARRIGYVTTLLGRRRYVPEINSDKRQVREFAERVAINTPLQGSAADLIKVAMIRIHQRLQQEKLSARMILQVHDELVFEAPEHELAQLEELVRHEMATAIRLEVPIKVGVGIGDNWLEAHD